MLSSSSHWASGPACRTKGETRLSRKQRLDRLQLSEEMYQGYKRLFLFRRRNDRYAIQKQDGAWPQYTYRWKDTLILQHLSGEINLAIPFAHMVDQMVLDIDCKKGRAFVEAETTVRAATEVLPGEPLIYRSSESNGIRMILFLKEAVHRTALFNWTVTELRNAGLTVKSGICEVRIGEGPDRLPFGRGSMLLHSSTLEPLEHLSLEGSLKFVSSHRLKYAIAPPALPIPTAEPNVGEYKSRVNAYLNSGLPAEHTTNDCLMTLAWHCRVLMGMDDEENEAFLKNWISHNHNDHSDRINSGKINKVFLQIGRIVADLKAEPGRGAKASKRVGLTPTEIEHLIDYPGNFKTLGGIFTILCYTKSNLRCKQRTLYSLNHSEGERVEVGTYKRGTVFHGSEDIPNGALNLRPCINLGKGLLRRMKVPNASNTAKFVREIEKMGILELKRKAWHDKHKVRQFWVNFRFDLIGEALEDDFDLALWRVLGVDGIKKRFTAHQAKRIEMRIEFKTRRESNAECNMALV